MSRHLQCGEQDEAAAPAGKAPGLFGCVFFQGKGKRHRSIDMEAIQGGCASVPTARIMASACLSVPPTNSCAGKALHKCSAQRCTPSRSAYAA